MKDFAKVLMSSLIGTMLGYGLASRAPMTAAEAERVETKELVVLGDAGRPVARIAARSGGAVLEIYDGTGSKAVELGFEEPGSSGFLRFLNRNGRVLAGLNSSAPKGAATLYLGDEDLQGRIAVGAIRTDLEEPIKEWGIEILGRGFPVPVFSLLTMPGRAPNTWRTGIRITKEDGKAWTAPN